VQTEEWFNQGGFAPTLAPAFIGIYIATFDRQHMFPVYQVTDGETTKLFAVRKDAKTGRPRCLTVDQDQVYGLSPSPEE